MSVVDIGSREIRRKRWTVKGIFVEQRIEFRKRQPREVAVYGNRQQQFQVCLDRHTVGGSQGIPQGMDAVIRPHTPIVVGITLGVLAVLVI